MARILVLYGTTEGHTARIAQHMAAAARRAGHGADVVRDTEALSGLTPSAYDAVLVAGSVHYTRFQKALTAFVKAHAGALNAMPSALFAVSGAACDAAKGREDARRALTDPFLRRTGWSPHMVEQVAGAFPFTQYAWWKKIMMKMILARGGITVETSKDYVYTDWDALDRAVAAFLSQALPA